MSYAAWVEVFVTHDQMEMEMIKGLLTTNGFEVVVEAKGWKQMPVIFGHAATGELVIKVPPDKADAAIALLAADVEMEPVDE